MREESLNLYVTALLQTISSADLYEDNLIYLVPNFILKRKDDEKNE